MRDESTPTQLPPAGPSRRLPGRRGPACLGDSLGLGVPKRRRGGLAGRCLRGQGRVLRHRPRRDHPRWAGRAGAWAGLGAREVGPAQTQPGRAVEVRPRMSTRTPRWSGRSPRSSGAGGRVRSSSPRVRGTAATRTSSSSSRPGAGARRGTARVRRPEPRRCLHSPGTACGSPAWPSSAARDAPQRADLIVSLPKLKTHHWAGSHLLDEEPLRSDARDLLRLAQERPSSGRDSRVDPRHQRGCGPAPRDRRRDHRHGGGRADHGFPAGCRRAGHGDEPAGRGRDVPPG